VVIMAALTFGSKTFAKDVSASRNRHVGKVL
jgi:hypothetical protein